MSKLAFSYVDSIHVIHLLLKSYHILVYYRIRDYKVLAEEHKHDKCTVKVQSKKNGNNLRTDDVIYSMQSHS